MPEICGYKPGDEKEILELFTRVFGKKRSMEHWRWENKENPRGESEFALLKDDGREGNRIKGHLCLHPFLLQAGGKQLMAGQRINLMLDKEYRGQSYFGKMFAHLLESGRKKGMLFTYGFPNAQSFKALRKVYNAKELGEIPRFVKFYDGFKAARHFLGNRLVAFVAGCFLQVLLGMKKKRTAKSEGVFEVTKFDSRFDELWQKAGQGLHVATVRDSVYLDWRYGRSARDYKIWAFAEEDGSISGYLVLLVEKEIGHIIDLLALEDSEALPALLGRAEAYCKDRCHTLSCWCLDRGQVSSVLQKHGFMRIRSPNRLVFANLDCPAGLEEILLDYNNWYITMGDSDYK